MNAITADEVGAIKDAVKGNVRPESSNIIAHNHLRSIVDRIERLEEERKAISSDIKDIYTESKSLGFDVKVLRRLLAIRKQDAADVEEAETLLDVYKRALGM